MTTANPYVLVVVGAVIGACVGLTGVGGGALMTPALLLLRVDPLTAVASDLVVSLVMKPIGATVHLRRGTVNKQLVKWLMIGSIPTAFLGAAAIERFGAASDIAPMLKRGIGVALLLAVASMMIRRWAAARSQRAREGAAGGGGAGPVAAGVVIGVAAPAVAAGAVGPGVVPANAVDARPPLRRGPTIALGIVGGLVVGLTSVGSGSLMIVGLMLLYPALGQRSLVGTDLAQAIPLVGAAALGHALFGSVSLGLAIPLILGAVPAVYVGARLSSRSNLSWVRSVLIVLLAASAAQLLGVSGRVTAAAALVAASLFGASRVRHSFRIRAVAVQP